MELHNPVIAYPLKLLLVLSCLCYCSQAASYDACKEPGAVKKGGPLLVGLAFWPNGTTDDWGDVQTGAHPCDPQNRSALIEANVGISYFRANVDELTLLLTANQHQDYYFSDNMTESDTYQVSIVAFRGKYRSAARLVSFARGTDAKFVDTLTLVARFDEGKMTNLEWFDFGCKECFAVDNRVCMKESNQDTCAFQGSNCQAVGRCLTGVHLAFEGSDKKSRVFTTTHQLRKLQSASIKDIYQGSRDLVSKASRSAEDAGGNIFGR